MICIHYYSPVNKIARVPDAEAHAAVKSLKARYVPKRMWKEKVRDVEKRAA